MDKKKESWLALTLKYAGEHRNEWYISIILSIISVTSGIIPYYCIYKIIDTYVYGTLNIEYCLKYCLFAALAYIVKIVCFSLSTLMSHSVAFNSLKNLRLKLADIFLKAPLGEVLSHSIGQIKNVLVDKIENIEPAVAHVVPEGAGHIVLPVVSIIALLMIDFRLALASLVTFPLAIIAMGLTFKISGKNFDEYNDSNIYMSSVIVEYVEGIEVIKTFGKSGVSYEKFANAINNYRKFVVKWLTSTLITMKFAFVSFPATLLGVLPVALYLASHDIITISEVALAILLAMSMIGSLSKIEVYSESFREIERVFDEVQSFINMPELSESKEAVEIKDHSIKLEDVSFNYDGQNDVIKHVNLELKEGSFTALVGPSGSGKSTIAKLITRFYDVTGGSIKVGNINIKDMPLSTLRENVSFVAQDNFLFNCSLLENIRLGNPKASDEEVIQAAKYAMCDEFIKTLPHGYDTTAGEAGKALSGGEKQRIAIARMILKDAPIVILDEATAFTDPINENKIQASLNYLTKDKTVLVIAHRLSTIKNADNIVVLDNGQVVASGKQEELLRNSMLYKDMWQAHIGVKNWAINQTEVA